MARFSIIAFILLTLLACGGEGKNLLPTSGGAAYEILVSSNTPAAINIVKGKLSNVYLEGLPQAETAYKISSMRENRIGQISSIARNVISIKCNSKLYTATHLKYQQDVYAHPQLFIEITTPSVKSLNEKIDSLLPDIIKLINQAEIDNEIKMLSKKHQSKILKIVEKAFGCKVWVPVDMQSYKQGKQFLWISDNAPSGMKSICIYTYHANEINPQKVVDIRDSVMRQNIPGERPTMYMHTVHNTIKNKWIKNKNLLETRGLWEMENDAMGGPFITHTILDTIHHRIIVIEGFVYAPEMEKKNKIRTLEAMLYTLAF